MRFEDDSVESAKIVKQWNVKIISVCNISCLLAIPFVQYNSYLIISKAVLFIAELCGISNDPADQQK